MESTSVPARASRVSVAGALAGSCHPGPALAVTVFATVLGAVAGLPAGTCAILTLAIAAGQLSIGWSNDRIDVARDRTAGRRDKPLARGQVPVAALDRCIAAAVVVCVVASLSLGWRAGVLHLAAVAMGWAYNLGVKATAWSWLPYAIAFGSLPGIATLAAAGHPAPAWWAVAAAALIGVGAHVTNVLPDLDDDASTGVRGMPHRLGARASLLLATLTLLAGSAVLVLGPPGAPAVLRLVGLGIVAAWTLVGCVAGWRRPQAAWLFAGTVAVAALDIVLLVVGPSFTGW